MIADVTARARYSSADAPDASAFLKPEHVRKRLSFNRGSYREKSPVRQRRFARHLEAETPHAGLPLLAGGDAGGDAGGEAGAKDTCHQCLVSGTTDRCLYRTRALPPSPATASFRSGEDLLPIFFFFFFFFFFFLHSTGSVIFLFWLLINSIMPNFMV